VRADYLDGGDGPLGDGVRDLVAARLGRRPGGRVLMLTNLRTWGWLTNPITVYWCLDERGDVDAVVLEVTNTPWHERVHYVVDAADGAARYDVAKAMHVSPFVEGDVTYRVEAGVPDRSLLVRIDVQRAGQTILHTSLAARRVPLSRLRAVTVLVRHPVITVRISAATYLHALRLWRKRVPVLRHPGGQAEPSPSVPVHEPGVAA
jgi:DUF1365 family protein